jgi:nucleoid-associated protein YgaU
MFEERLDIEHAFDHDAPMSRTRVRRRRFTMTVAVVGLLLVVSGQVAGALGSHGPALRPAARRTYVVEQGDTLWGIATRVAEGRDPREVVDRLEALNEIDAGSLQPGIVLRIPTLG